MFTTIGRLAARFLTKPNIIEKYTANPLVRTTFRYIPNWIEGEWHRGKTGGKVAELDIALANNQR